MAFNSSFLSSLRFLSGNVQEAVAESPSSLRALRWPLDVTT